MYSFQQPQQVGNGLPSTPYQGRRRRVVRVKTETPDMNEHRNNESTAQSEEESPSKLTTAYQELLLLTGNQQHAFNYVYMNARSFHQRDYFPLVSRLARMGYTQQQLDRFLTYIRDDVPLIIHVKEDRLYQLTLDTHYRSCFEVACRKSAYIGKRIQWEDKMFDYAFVNKNRDRPKYACLNVTGDICGSYETRVFGDFVITLQPHVRHRSTFIDRCSGPSASGRAAHAATCEFYAHVVYSWTDEEIRAVLELNHLMGSKSDAMVGYKEVQIHGPIELAKDILSLSVPGSERYAAEYRRRIVHTFQQQTGCAILWQKDLLGY